MTLAADFAQNLKLQADIVRVVGEYVSLKRAGAQNFSGLCPFHKEKTPSFSVHATRQFYYCFGGGEKRDVCSFVQKIENITFPEAVRAVAQKMGVALPKQTFSSEAEAKDAKLRTVLLEIHDRACAFFQDCLRRPEGARAREYLAGRGLNEETIKKFRLGFAPDSGFVLRDRLKGEFAEDVLRESGLFSWKEGSGVQAGLQASGSGLQASGSRLQENHSPLPPSNSVIPSESGSQASERSTEVEGPAVLSKPEAEPLKPEAQSPKPEARSPKPEAGF